MILCPLNKALYLKKMMMLFRFIARFLFSSRCCNCGLYNNLWHLLRGEVTSGKRMSVVKCVGRFGAANCQCNCWYSPFSYPVFFTLVWLSDSSMFLWMFHCLTFIFLCVCDCFRLSDKTRIANFRHASMISRHWNSICIVHTPRCPPHCHKLTFHYLRCGAAKCMEEREREREREKGLLAVWGRECEGLAIWLSSFGEFVVQLVARIAACGYQFPSTLRKICKTVTHTHTHTYLYRLQSAQIPSIRI